MLLSSGEKQAMKLLLNEEANDLPSDFTKIIEDFYENEQNLEKIDLDQYIADYALYAIDKEEIHKVDKLDTQTRIKLNFLENTYALDEEYVKYNRLNAEDTIIINIGQEYVHSTQDFLTTNNKQDFARAQSS
uniref:Uncharacterized protein n=1 Tax=Romanomermis culicivorax TaxID=13658 RepID=A0A915JIZ4_ROMCU